ncbi:carboxypeptidase-like regulatory domain-containing protein [Salegentibacter sp. F188]|uniref:Carboxypeptidase-like regulatory domain-containing protein n=1 Tax=Autumnicola patrickiae TaxID=3075591 RepID=A0ABU3E5I4_9FLAO|nr:carboxypeptidase-like regulatory domain-containing protein [Salegentibacter sp. F188]MDT0691200.1 carboxypeptidase-like regulatory domain-containing protein [Salegentibacter sp. F188]
MIANKWKKFFLFISLVIIHNKAQSQSEIIGSVEDYKGNPVERASILLQDAEENILGYDYSNKEGEFVLQLEEPELNLEILVVVCQSLGYEVQMDTISNLESNKGYEVNFRLKEKIEQLNEVVLESSQKISAEGNVTTLRTAPFSDDTEQTVEDMLKKLPGIEVLEDGSIKAHGKFINKLLIEGEDMFANDYQLLSKNLDAEVLEAVEIIEAFEDNPVLATVLDSDKVALNLKLNDELKNIWFGNIKVGTGTSERVMGDANIGLLRNKIKLFYFGNINNLGNKASDQLGTSPSSLNISTAYQEERIENDIKPVYSINKRENNILKEGQSIFNMAFSNSIGLVTKLTPKLSIRATGAFINDNQDQAFNSETIFAVDENPINIQEISHTNHINRIGNGELELKYSIGSKSYLKNVLVYQNHPENYRNRLLFNENIINQTLSNKESSIYNHLNYSYALNRRHVINSYLYMGRNEVQQKTSIESPILNHLFSVPDDSFIRQGSQDLVKSYGLKTNLFSDWGKLEHRLDLAVEALNKNRRTHLGLDVPNAGDNVVLDSLHNNLLFTQKEIKLKSKTSYSFSEKIKIGIGLSFNYLDLSTGIQSKNGWIFNPEIDLDLRKLKMGRFKFSYGKTYGLPESNVFLQNYHLTNYRSFQRGLGDLNLIEREAFKFNYRWANDLESQAITLRLKYDNSDNKYTTTNLINENYSLSTFRFVSGGERFSGNLDFTSYYEKLNFSTNLRTSQNLSATPIAANSSEFRELRNYSSSYHLTASTYFDSPINYSFGLNYYKNESQFNGIVSASQWANESFEITYFISSEWSATLNNELYQIENSSSYFLGSTINYKPDNKDLSYRLALHNLANEKRLNTVAIDEFMTYRSSVPLIPRYVYLEIKYRF